MRGLAKEHPVMGVFFIPKIRKAVAVCQMRL